MAYHPKHLNPGRHKKSYLQRILGCLFVCMFFFAAFMLLKEVLQAHNEQTAFEELAAVVAEAEEEQNEMAQPEFFPVTSLKDDEPYAITSAPVILPQYRLLYEQNNDFFGWISIEGTDIDYPVMYTPHDSEYYLRTAFDGSYSESGTPFIDGKCPADGNCYLIYGHNMKNKTMFGQLPQYAEQSFWEEHSIICFDTLHEKREYRVIAAFYSKIYSEDDTGAFRYYEYTDLSDEAVFEEYIGQVKTAAIYDTGYDAKYGDNLLALSTCAYHTDNGRFVVVAKQIQ